MKKILTIVTTIIITFILTTIFITNTIKIADIENENITIEILGQKQLYYFKK